MFKLFRLLLIYIQVYHFIKFSEFGGSCKINLISIPSTSIISFPICNVVSSVYSYSEISTLPKNDVFPLETKHFYQFYSKMLAIICSQNIWPDIQKQILDVQQKFFEFFWIFDRRRKRHFRNFLEFPVTIGPHSSIVMSHLSCHIA